MIIEREPSQSGTTPASRRRRLLPALLLVLPVAASAQTDETSRLDAVRERIEAVNEALAADREREDALSAELRRLDDRVQAAAAELRDSREAVAEATRRVEAAREARDAERERVARHRRTLAEAIRAAHRGGREEYLRLLLNQERPDRVDRVLAYYEYLSEARTERLDEAISALQTLRHREQALAAEIDERRALERETASRVAALASAREERGQRLEALRERLRTQDRELAQLREDEAHLAEVVAQLRERLADIPAGVGADEAFAARRGELGWPIDGPIVADYGSSRSGGMRWTGVLIGASVGDPVAAVAHGRVVFADWLRGLGLLIIIDHGDGYMSLYGHNESLYREAGDWVRTGDVISSVGGSAQGREALYFEVRTDGKPVDPLAWLRAEPARG